MLIVWTQAKRLKAHWNEDDSGDALKHFHLCSMDTPQETKMNLFNDFEFLIKNLLAATPLDLSL